MWIMIEYENYDKHLDNLYNEIKQLDILIAQKEKMVKRRDELKARNGLLSDTHTLSEVSSASSAGAAEWRYDESDGRFKNVSQLKSQNKGCMTSFLYLVASYFIAAPFAFFAGPISIIVWIAAFWWLSNREKLTFNKMQKELDSINENLPKSNEQQQRLETSCKDLIICLNRNKRKDIVKLLRAIESKEKRNADFTKLIEKYVEYDRQVVQKIQEINNIAARINLGTLITISSL